MRENLYKYNNIENEQFEILRTFFVLVVMLVFYYWVRNRSQVKNPNIAD